MILALGAGQHLLDVIEAADETGAQIEAFRPKLIRAAPRRSERGVIPSPIISAPADSSADVSQLLGSS
jgi:hypothetical protein